MHVLIVDYTSDDAPLRFCHSLRETGFAVLSHHPIPTHLIQEVYTGWETFFNSDEKFSFLHQKPSQDGYFPFRTETAKNNKISDLKEFFHFYPRGKKPPELQHISYKMFQALQTLAAELLQWIEDHLPEEVAHNLPMPLRDMVEDSPNTLLRILHYPPFTTEFEQDAVRAAPHEDINFITLLPAATAPGLEVLDSKGHWHEVPCDPGNIVVNIGDMLEICTQNYYKSTTHRVVNPTNFTRNHSRYSMPLFLHPRPEVPLTESRTAQDILDERLKAIGIY